MLMKKMKDMYWRNALETINIKYKIKVIQKNVNNNVISIGINLIKIINIVLKNKIVMMYMMKMDNYYHI